MGAAVGATAVGSRIGAVEAKGIERIEIGWDVEGGAGGDRDGMVQLDRQRRAEIDQVSGDRVSKNQPRRMQEVTAWRKSYQLATPAPAIRVVADDRVPDRR